MVRLLSVSCTLVELLEVKSSMEGFTNEFTLNVPEVVFSGLVTFPVSRVVNVVAG